MKTGISHEARSKCETTGVFDLLPCTGLSFARTSALISQHSVLAVALTAIFFALCVSAQAQQTESIPRIGFLCAAPPTAVEERAEAFQEGLRELGYVEGRNIVIEYRYANGKLDRIAALAAELVSLKVDTIVTVGGMDTRAAKKATKTIPIVMTQDPDPVGSGFVASLARPGGNITGLSTLAPEIGGKRLELLKEIIPKLSRVAVLGTSTNPINSEALREVERVATGFEVKLHYQDVLRSQDIYAAFRAATKGGTDAVLILPAPVFLPARKLIAGLAVKNRLPTVYDRREFVDDGGLISYGTSIPYLARRAARYVDKILKGAKPSELPVEQPTKFELAINLKTARQIGLTIPPNVLARADRVIR